MGLCVAEGLPRVLMVGDSVYRTPSQEAAKMVKGRVEVVYRQVEPGSVLSTKSALAGFDALLGEEKWDLIHFNFGLADLVYRVPNVESFRVMARSAGGVRTTSPERYEKNLRELVKRFKATGSRLMWASTTPILRSASDIFEVDSELQYNAIAAKIMADQQVPINDMHAYVLTQIDVAKPGSEPFSFDRKPLHPPIVRNVLKELDLIRPVKGPVKVFIMVGGWLHIGGGIVVNAEKPSPGQNRGTLDDLVLNKRSAGEYAHFLEEDGSWLTRPDVWVQYDRRWAEAGTLGIGYGGDRKRGVGLELQLGHRLGDHFEEQVCIIKTTIGQPSLVTDLRPPSSGVTGKQYTAVIEQVRASLTSFEHKYPSYTRGTAIDVSGLILEVGEKDTKADVYAEYLPMLIADLRKDLKVDKLPVVLIGSGRGGREKPECLDIIKAQQSIVAMEAFKGNVTYVETRDYWPPEDARDAWRHPSHEQWYNNAESFLEIGEAVADGMLGLLSRE